MDKSLLKSGFVSTPMTLGKATQRKDLKSKLAENASAFAVINKYFMQDRYKRTHPLTKVQQAQVSQMGDKDKRNIQILTYRMVNLSKKFEDLWTASGKVEWHSSLRAFMMTELTELANDIFKAQQSKAWPNIKIKNGE